MGFSHFSTMMMEKWASCLSFLWPDRCRNHDDPSASTTASCPSDLWDPLRINDPAGFRLALEMLMDGHDDVNDVDDQIKIPLSRLLLPLRRRWITGWPDEEDADVVVGIEDIVAVAATVDSVACIRGLESAFEFYDRDGDGAISAVDLEEALRDVVEVEAVASASWSRTCETMVRAFDRDRRGGVGFDDFVRMMGST